VNTFVFGSRKSLIAIGMHCYIVEMENQKLIFVCCAAESTELWKARQKFCLG